MASPRRARGEIRRGTLQAELLAARSFNWRVDSGLNVLRNELTSLGDLGPFGCNDAMFLEGHPLASVYGHAIRRIDVDGGRVIVSDSAEVLADFSGHFASKIRIFEQVTLRSQLDWETGLLVENITQDLRDHSIVLSRPAYDPESIPAGGCLRRFGPYVSESGESISRGRVLPYMEEGD